ncbi:haloalkane dehalogenase [Lewinella sp. W8]|uniref:haloalkane dehalogenase n=1 Tax=Lewinella sp. W8 TaxID=2528208 RepID=UPI001068CD40|nr:alpha/beta fold hydrolase [Lewinella sp. W8]
MPSLRTPEDRFSGLRDYPFSPNYCTVSGELRLHYLDENPAADRVVVCLHGEPSWSYLYRKMIPLLTGAGYRVVAPDLIGFGRSDKPLRETDYTYARHVDWVREVLFDHLDLRDVHLFAQDWGGLIGLRLLAEHPERFSRVAIANTFLPTGDQDLGKAFLRWREMARQMDPFPAGDILQMASLTTLTAEEISAYDAPFPDERYKAGARIFPALVPAGPQDPATPANRRAWEKLRQLELPFLTLFSDGDPITAGAEKFFHQQVPGARGQEHHTISGGGHFLQEDQPDQIVEHLVSFFGDR